MNSIAMDYASQALYLVLVISLPPIVIASVIGIVLSLVQAVTQLQEQTLSFGVKLIAVVLTLFLSVVQPITYRMGLTYSPDHALKFSKKQIAMLALLFVFGSGCVVGYLGYYYDTTSLSASYTAEERYDINCRMTEILLEETDEYDDDTLVTTVESSYQKFMGSEITYNVAVYVVDETALAGYDKDLETIRGMSKSKAKAVAEDGVMTLDSYATIVVNKKTGQILSCEYAPAD